MHRRVQRATYEYSQLSQCEGGAAEPPAANDELGLAMPSTDEEVTTRVLVAKVKTGIGVPISQEETGYIFARLHFCHVALTI